MYDYYQHIYYQYTNLQPDEGDVTEKKTLSFFFFNEKFEGKHVDFSYSKSLKMANA